MTRPRLAAGDRPRNTLAHRTRGAILFGSERVREPLARRLPRRAPRALVVTRLPAYPPGSGEHIRNWENIRALGRIGEVDALSIFGRRPRPPGVRGLRAWESLEAGRNFHERWDPGDRLGLTPVAFSDEVAAAFRAFLRRRRPDLVVLEQLGQHVFVPLIRETGARVVLDNHNVEGMLAEALQGGVSRDGAAAEVAATEAAVARTVDAVWVCSETDAALMHERYGLERQPVVVPNVVDFQAYRTARGAWRERLRAPAPVVVYPAHFGYPPNEEAAMVLARDIMPLLRERFPAARLILVGRAPTAAMRAYGTADVEITGPVVDVRPYLSRSTVMAIPLHAGSGTRFKAIEAFAAALPVVSTAKGVEGLALADGVHFLRAETPGEFADAIARLHGEGQLARRLMREAYRLGFERYSPVAVERAIRASLLGLGLLSA